MGLWHEGRKAPAKSHQGDDEATVHGAAQPRYRTVSKRAEAEELASFLLRHDRAQPVVVITTGRDGFRVDPESMASRLGREADVWVITTMGAAFDFSDAMPDETAVYNGAVRSYPPGNAWTRAPRKSVLRLIYSDEDARRAIEEVPADVEAMMPLIPALSAAAQTKAPEPARDIVRATVTGFDGPGTALVGLPDGATARVLLPDFGPLVKPGMLLAIGQEVDGTLEGGTFQLEATTTGEATDDASPGTVLPALVTGPKTIMLFPGLEVRYRTDAASGTVVAVKVELTGRADGKAWRLSPADLNEADEALAYVPGGAPWLQPTSPMDEAPPPHAHPEDAGLSTFEPSSADDDVLAALDLVRSRFERASADRQRLGAERDDLEQQVEQLRGQLAQAAAAAAGAAPVPLAPEGARLHAQIAVLANEKREMTQDLRNAIEEADDLAAANSALQQQVKHLREAVRTERERANRARQASKDVDVEAKRPLFTDPEQEFRHDVYVEWATRIPAASKADLPLTEYGLAEGFLESVESLQGIDRSKIVAVAVEVLTGRQERMPSRDMHRLRESPAGGSPFVEHPVHGTAWRVSLQTATAAARRLHFWRSSQGRIVLKSVRVHDDTEN